MAESDDPIKAEAERLAGIAAACDEWREITLEIETALRRQREEGARENDQPRHETEHAGEKHPPELSCYICRCEINAYQRGLAEAALAEREACLKIVVDGDDPDDMADEIAARIRPGESAAELLDMRTREKK